jgi:hypothetical protein
VTSASVIEGLSLDGLSSAERGVITDAVDDIQLRSKRWLLDELDDIDPLTDSTVLVMGGWCGVLPWLRHVSGRATPAMTVSVDFDERACRIGARIIGPTTPSLYFVCQDIHRLNYARIARGRQLVIINTVCEHLPDFAGWRRLVPPGTLTVLQSNDYRGCPDHVNCVDSAAELEAAADLSEVTFVGSLPLSLFTRFMVIGRT